jgi:hypothetical protein
MRKTPYIRITTVLILLTGILTGSASIAEEKKTPVASKGGIYIELTEVFYKALKEDAGDTRRYSNQMSETHLRQIAISTRFMVETNLQILRQQEKMIELLEEIRSKAK